MRGKHSSPERNLERRRIIPAHAGQTGCWAWRWGARRDHPRACGANGTFSVAHARGAGSSPRMRGKLPVGGALASRGRIIPAHAGQTQCSIHGRAWSPDHPRACGANSNKGSATVSASGSSPRMRGKRRFRPLPSLRVRIIPAHAGQTSTGHRRPAAWPDHPRACGANSDNSSTTTSKSGSSPRMRGKLG